MKRQIVVVGALWTVLSALACGSNETHHVNENGNADAAIEAESTQAQTAERQSSTASGKPDPDKSTASVEMDSCTKLNCDKRASCVESAGKARCVCAAGLIDRDGGCVAPDGKSCKDNPDCEHGHCVQGICCKQACSSPEAECRDIEAASCDDGQTCQYPQAKDGATCADADACKLGSVCKGGACQAGTKARDCDDKNPCTDDSCDPKLGCTNQNNSRACDDKNACTEADQCRNGACQGAQQRDCSAQADACNEGVCDPADGNCKKRPAAEGSSCDDADSCSKADTCKAGACRGDNACGPNAITCSAGSPNSCTCAASYHAAAGLCVPDNDECSGNPCGANADCFDPSNGAGDVTCACKPGFAGDAKAGCSAKDPCQDNPCGEGRGTCSAKAGNQHSCSCGAGFREVAGQCVCDMQGTFALRYESAVSWKNIDGIENGNDQSHSWAIVRQNYEASGNLKLELISCGETNIDLCGTGVRIAGIAAEAYSQYVPVAVWGAAAGPSTLVEFNLPAPVPGSAYKTPRYAVLNGISLSDPLGDWPAKRQEVQGGSDFAGSATNGARWIDSDQDSLYGLTTYAVGPGGQTPGGALAPITPYAQTSMACPRGAASAARLPYNYPPGLDGLAARRVKRFSSANRAISELDGKLQSCDVISGNVTGPENGRAHLDVRIGSCVRADGTSEVACSSALLDFLDAAQAPSAIDTQSFSMKRVDATITCAQVRALSF